MTGVTGDGGDQLIALIGHTLSEYFMMLGQ